MARFVYRGDLYGEWTPARPDDPMMVPNPEYAGELIGVQFKEGANEVPLRKPKSRTHKIGTLRNGVRGTSLGTELRQHERS